MLIRDVNRSEEKKNKKDKCQETDVNTRSVLEEFKPPPGK